MSNKIVYGAVVLWVAYIVFQNATTITSDRSQAKKELGYTMMDRQIDNMNRVSNTTPKEPRNSGYNNKKREPPTVGMFI